MSIPQEIGRQIRKAREATGLTQAELGKLWGQRSHAVISDIERGKVRVAADELTALARILHTDISMLLGLEETTSARYFRAEEVNPHVMERFEEAAREQWTRRKSNTK